MDFEILVDIAEVETMAVGSATSTEAVTSPAEVPEFAVCICNDGYPASLELHKIYRVLPDEQAARDADVQIVDESGEDYLYPAAWFVRVRLPQRVRSSLVKAS